MYNHNKAQQSKNRVHISWDILYVYWYPIVLLMWADTVTSILLNTGHLIEANLGNLGAQSHITYPKLLTLYVLKFPEGTKTSIYILFLHFVMIFANFICTAYILFQVIHEIRAMSTHERISVNNMANVEPIPCPSICYAQQVHLIKRLPRAFIATSVLQSWELSIQCIWNRHAHTKSNPKGIA